MNDVSPGTTRARDAGESLAIDLQLMVLHSQELLQATGAQSGDAVVAAREKLNKSLSAASKKLSELQHSAQRRSGAVVGTLQQHVRERPAESVAVAALTILAGGWLAYGEATGVPKNIVRFTALGIVGAAAAAVLWTFRSGAERFKKAPPAEEVGRWEGEGGSALGSNATL
jgi:ElaB/YqjD/DUF883 family membrane-anchored ribosome-binding protein